MVAPQSSFSHLTKMPSVLTVRSSGGATAPILSVSRLNQAIGWPFYAAAPGVSKSVKECQRKSKSVKESQRKSKIRSQPGQIHIAARKQNAGATAREI